MATLLWVDKSLDERVVTPAEVTLDRTYDPPTRPERGKVTIERYVAELTEAGQPIA
ncbi:MULTISPECIES: hypothetical protein [Mesorhizobium]|uniref:hypothetical protein n=1 Tax=Mesorhizobium TaxID=68287 RepID=UPI001459FC42|nr:MULTISPECIES: hypothetical protein [Mesorhizobium]